jgi:hypothetical protein
VFIYLIFYTIKKLFRSYTWELLYQIHCYLCQDFLCFISYALVGPWLLKCECQKWNFNSQGPIILAGGKKVPGTLVSGDYSDLSTSAMES